MFHGPAHATDSLLMLLQPYFRAPTIWTRAGTPLELPHETCGTIVVRDASTLSRDQQAVLSRWLDTDRRQVVSTTERSLLPLIAEGLFDQALYYRMNVVFLRIDGSGALV